MFTLYTDNFNIFYIIILFVMCFINIKYKTTIINSNDIENYLDSKEIVKNIFLVSYYYDERFNSIRIILYKHNNSRNIRYLKCKIKYSQTYKLCKMKILDKLSEENTVMNILISIKKYPKQIILNNHTLNVNLLRRKKKGKKKITVCIGKMINYTAYNMLVQMIEAYRVFGVDYFVIYKTSSSKQVDKVLNYYSKFGLLSVVTWRNNFDLKYSKHKTYGQRVKLNDCFYRYYHSTDSIIMTDLDEIIWPTNNENLLTMINYVEKYDNRNYDTYIFQEIIYKRNYVPYFDRLVHNIEDCDIFEYHSCCKYTWHWPKLFIKNLSKITSVSIHWITGHIDNHTQKRVDPNIGFVRHTRRVYPYILSGTQGKWSYCKSDRKENIIKERAKRIIKKLKLKYH